MAQHQASRIRRQIIGSGRRDPARFVSKWDRFIPIWDAVERCAWTAVTLLLESMLRINTSAPQSSFFLPPKSEILAPGIRWHVSCPSYPATPQNHTGILALYAPAAVQVAGVFYLC